MRMDVVISEAAEEYILDHGGMIFVRSHPHRCCSGELTLLDCSTTLPVDAADFQAFDTDAVRVRFSGGDSGLPHHLVIELRGLLRRHPVAYWDGCAFKP
jgi:hypothetical protein